MKTIDFNLMVAELVKAEPQVAELLSGYIAENKELKKMVGELSEKNRELRAQLEGQKEFML